MKLACLAVISALFIFYPTVAMACDPILAPVDTIDDRAKELLFPDGKATTNFIGDVKLVSFEEGNGSYIDRTLSFVVVRQFGGPPLERFVAKGGNFCQQYEGEIGETTLVLAYMLNENGGMPKWSAYTLEHTIFEVSWPGQEKETLIKLRAALEKYSKNMESKK